MEKEEAKQHIQDRMEYEAREIMEEQQDPDKEYDAYVDKKEIEKAQTSIEYFNEFLIEWSDLSFEKRHLVSGKVASHIHEILGGCDEDWAMDTARDICEREFPHWIKISICKDKEELCI